MYYLSSNKTQRAHLISSSSQHSVLCSNHNLWKTHQKSIISLAILLPIIMTILGRYTEHKSEWPSNVISIFSHHNKAEEHMPWICLPPLQVCLSSFFLQDFSAINCSKCLIKKLMYVGKLLGSNPVHSLWKFTGGLNLKPCGNMHKTKLVPKQYASEKPTPFHPFTSAQNIHV